MSAGAALRAADAADALDIAVKLVDNAAARAEMIAAGLRYVGAHAGAVERIVQDVSQLLSERGIIPGKVGAVSHGNPALQFLF